MILVTGAAGFIAFHLIKSLLKNKIPTLGIDNFDPYYSPQLKKENLKDLYQYKYFYFKQCDITKQESLANLFKKHDIHLVYHVAARPGVRPSFINPLIYDKINVGGTLKLLQTCQKAGVKRFIFISSSSVYGNNKTPFTESDYPLRPLSFYGASKLNAEEVCKFFARRFEFQIWIFRLFSVYGPRLRPDLAMYKFTNAILKNQQIQLYNYGNYQRDFTYIDSVVDALIKAKEKFPKQYEVVNLGNSQPISIKTIVELLEEKLNKKAKILYVKNPFNENPITYANINKAKKLLNYTAHFPIDDGINIFLDWFLSKCLKYSKFY